MCLGMMSNSGAERRHEYGRRAFRRSLCGGCWAKYDQDLANKANMSAFLTLREILIWQYGSDLLSHEKARRAAALSADARASESGTDPRSVPDGAPSEEPQARVNLTRENLKKHCDLADGLNRLLEPLLSPTEVEDESRRDAPMNESPEAASGLGETAQAGWQRVEHDQSLALNSIPVPHDEADGLPADRCYSDSARGEKTYDIGRDPRLTNGICDVVSDVDGDGSEDCSSDGGSDSDSSDCSSDGGPRVRFGDLEDFSEDDDDSDFCGEEITPSWRDQDMYRTRSERAVTGAHPVTEAGHQDKAGSAPMTGPAATADSDTTGENATAAPLIRTVGAAGDSGRGPGLGAAGSARPVQNNAKKPAQRRSRPALTTEQRAAKRREALTLAFRDDSIISC